MTHHARVVSIGLLVAMWCGLPGVAQAAVPHLIRFQGQAVDSQGVPLEGPYTLTFRLYDAQTAGTIVWQEQQANVPISGGHFSVLLGQITALNVDWSRSSWLSVQVGTDPELSPRQQITSVPLAIMAEQLAVPVTTSTITDDANRLVPTGSIMLWNGGSCPAGYTRLSALDGKFLVGGGSYSAAAGGSNTHTHGTGSYAAPPHTHSISDVSRGIGWNASNGYNPVGSTVAVVATDFQSAVAESSGAGAISGTSGSSDSRPEFATVLLCQKN